MSTDLEDREKEKVSRQASEAQREKELERDRKNKGNIFVGRTTWNLVAAVRKWEMPAATRVKLSDSEKKSEQEHVPHFLQNTCKQEVSGSFTL